MFNPLMFKEHFNNKYTPIFETISIKNLRNKLIKRPGST